jgi:hypothetical protein
LYTKKYLDTTPENIFRVKQFLGVDLFRQRFFCIQEIKLKSLMLKSELSFDSEEGFLQIVVDFHVVLSTGLAEFSQSGHDRHDCFQGGGCPKASDKLTCIERTKEFV